MREKPNLDILEILLNYEKTEKYDYKILYSEGNGWVLKSELEESFLSGKKHKSKWIAELKSRGYKLLNHPWIESRNKFNQPLRLLDKSQTEWKKSGYRLRRDLDTWKKLYKYYYEIDLLSVFTESDYYLDLIQHRETELNNFIKLFPSKEVALAMPELFYLFLSDAKGAKLKAKSLNKTYSSAIEEKITQRFKAEHERLVAISKRALALSKQKSI